jgi:hypothetical protein
LWFPLQLIFRLFLEEFQPISFNQIRHPGRVLRALTPLIKIQIQRPNLNRVANVSQWAIGLLSVKARGDVGLVLGMGVNSVGVLLGLNLKSFGPPKESAWLSPWKMKGHALFPPLPPTTPEEIAIPKVSNLPQATVLIATPRRRLLLPPTAATTSSAPS